MAYSETKFSSECCREKEPKTVSIRFIVSKKQFLTLIVLSINNRQEDF